MQIRVGNDIIEKKKAISLVTFWHQPIYAK